MDYRLNKVSKRDYNLLIWDQNQVLFSTKIKQKSSFDKCVNINVMR